MIKKVRFWLCMVMVIFLLITMTGWSADKKKVIKLGFVTVPTHGLGVTMDKYAELIKERTNGRCQITLYPAGQLGGDRDMFESIESGALEMGLISTSVIENFVPEMAAYQLPWLFKDDATMQKAFVSDAANKILDRLTTVGVKGIGIYNCGFRNFLNTKKPINRPEDLKGMTFRSVESPFVLKMFQLLGANPVTIPKGEVYTALQTNMVEGLEWGWEGSYLNKYWEVAKFYSVDRHYSWPEALVINKKFWDQMTPEDQKIFWDTSKECVQLCNKIYQERDKEAETKYAPQLGVKINYIEDTKPFRDAMKPLYDEYMTKYPQIKEFVDYVNEISK